MNNLKLHLPINNVHLWATFIVIIVLFVVVSFVLSFHWQYYGVKGNPRVYVKGLYFIISIIILLIALSFLTLYNIT